MDRLVRRSLTTMTRLRCAIVAALAIGCAAPPPEVFVPGVSGGALDDRLEVIVIDERTREPVEATVDVLYLDGRALPAQRGIGPLVFEDPQLRPPYTIRVRGSLEAFALIGARGARVVIALAAPLDPPRLDVEIHDVAGASELVVHVPEPVRFFGRGIVGSPVRGWSGEPTRLAVPAPPGAAVLVEARAADGSSRFAWIPAVGGDRAHVIDLDGATAGIELEHPPIVGLDPELVVVRVRPAVSTRGALALLDGPMLPPIDGSIDDLGWWLVATAEPVLAERDPRRSVVLQRELRAPEEVGGWPGWLDVPSASIAADGGVTLGRVMAAGAYVIEWSDPPARALVLGHVARVAPPLEGIAPRRALVRALDAEAIDPTSLEFAELERRVHRYSEIVVELPPP